MTVSVPVASPGDELELEVGPVAHGGHCVARHEGQVVFVRHALPGERVRAVVVEGGPGAKFLRADALEVLTASPDRVVAPCPKAHPGGCGGCDFQHVALPAQRALKAAVVAEQFRRLAKLEVDVAVLPVPGDVDGLRWRTRNRFALDTAGHPGLRRYRSHDVEPLDDCLIAHPLVVADGVLDLPWPGVSELAVAVSVSTGERVILADGEARGRARLTEQAAGRSWRVTGAGFWQVHPGAAETLVAAVRAGLGAQPGEVLLDLYSGVGLFAGSLADDLGVTGAVHAVEADSGAVRDARRNLHDLPMVSLIAARVDQWLRAGAVPRCDLVVLDPPRSGAGRVVVDQIAAREPRAVAYVACDPASLARDVATFAGHGYTLAGLTAYDVFPMTHHVECVAILRKVS